MMRASTKKEPPINTRFLGVPYIHLDSIMNNRFRFLRPKLTLISVYYITIMWKCIFFNYSPL